LADAAGQIILRRRPLVVILPLLAMGILFVNLGVKP